MSAHANDFNEGELEAPAWMDKEYFEKVLRHCEKTENLKLKSLKLAPATGKGGHYASVMFRVIVNYSLNNEDKAKSMIIKTMPEHEGIQAETFKESHIFKTEIGVYSEIIPKFEAILQAAGDNTKLVANCLYSTLTPKQVIIFEDIVPLGYDVMPDLPDDLNHVKAIYTKLAKWHAASYKLNSENPHIFDDYNNGHFMQAGLRDSESFNDGITNFIDLLDSYDDLRPYKRYFEPLVGKIVNYCVKSSLEARENPQINGLYVLCHGDFHFKNLMFKHDMKTKELLDLLLLDFQMCYFGPMVHDVLYSIYLLLNEDLRLNHLEELLYFYFTTFQETLRKVGFTGKVPSVLEFRQQLMRHKHFEIFLLVTFLPIWYIFAPGEKTLEELITDHELRKSIFHNPKYLAEIRIKLPKLLHGGYLEL